VPGPGATAGPAGLAGITGLARLGGTAGPGGSGTLAEPLVRDWHPPFPIDVRMTLSVHHRGGGDPAFRIDGAGAVWRTSLTPDGPATLRVTSGRQRASRDVPAVADGLAPAGGSMTAGGRACGDAVVTAAAWGPGATWLLETVPDMLGACDERAGFAPAHPVLRRMAARHAGLRIGRTGRVMEALVPAVLEQKVATVEAHRAWRALMLRFGTPAPGPAPGGMRVFPPPRTWARIPPWEWHRAGVEAVRARTIAAACRVAGRMEEIFAMGAAEASRRLRYIPGIGVWTAAEVMQRACGDPDAVSVGDYNLPAAVGWALAGRIVDDAGMLELLAPYAGHRYRVTRLVKLSGLRPPRRGPRLPIRDYRSF
jgi:3-methyladenine DNA glycosylase/8-oxoguanine DNA glycosylase